MNENASDEKKDVLLEKMQNMLIIGDLNGEDGNQNERMEECIGKEGDETKNNNGDILIELVYTENSLIILTTKEEEKYQQ